MISILITPETDYPNETATATRCLEAGLDRLHIRKPGFTPEDYSNYIRKIDERYHSRIVLHGAFELVETYYLGGIHMNAAVRTDKALTDRIGTLAPVPLSASFHAWEEIEEGELHYQYAFISPVFSSISKKDYGPSVDLKGAAAVKQRLEDRNRYCPSLIGLGGVNADNIARLKEHDFDGAAILGAVWMAADPVRSFTDIIAALQFH